MPRRIDCPLFALASAFDASDWSGLDVCQRQGGGPMITLPTYGPEESVGAGDYLDALHFLTGFGVENPRHLGALLTTAWAAIGGAGTIGATIGALDRIEVSNGGAVDLILRAGAAGNARFGVASAGTTVPAGTTVTLPNEWLRGVIDPDEVLSLGRAASTIEVTLRRVQDVRIATRRHNDVDDLDDGGGPTLQSLDPLNWWGIEAGHVWWATTAVTTGMDWASTTFRDRLGFTGDEVLTTWGTSTRAVSGQIADKPLPGWIEPSRPLRRQRWRVETVGAEVRLLDGSYSGIQHGAYRGQLLEGWIDGVHDAGDDLHDHWLTLLSEYAPIGRPLTLYQDVGDSRRALRPALISADQPAYGSLYTSEVRGYRGRVLCRVNPDSGRITEIEQTGRYRRRHPFDLVLDEREAGV